MSFEELEAIMRRDYDSPARQIQVTSELETLDVRRFMSFKCVTEEFPGLKQLMYHISAISSECQSGIQV